MRLTTVLLLASLLQVSASGLAQKITVSKSSASLKSVLKEISAQSGYLFLYSDAVMNQAIPVDIDVKNKKIEEVLEVIFDNQPLSYNVNKTTITLRGKGHGSILESVSALLSARDIQGRVVNDDGIPISGVNVRKRSGGRSVITDAKGAFAINVDDDKTVLVFSYVGYLNKEAIAKPGMVVTMNASSNKLDETVVVGYGTTRRRDLTGSVSSINVEEVRDAPFAAIDQALSGKSAGVQVVQSDGSPGGAAKIRIRGGTSLIGGNDPLYIVDGVQVQVQNNFLQTAADVVSPVERAGADSPNNAVSGAFARALNSLGGLNINDIESIDILKDASATAIYGSRAANGVVIITTKKGKYNQKATLETNYYTNISSARAEKLLNRDQYMTILKEGAVNLNTARAARNLAADPVATNIISGAFFEGGDTNWMDLVLRTGFTQNADISVRGGGIGSRYYTSLAYMKNNGVVKGTDFSRIGGKVSLDNDITARLHISTNLDFGFTSNNVSNGVYTQALYAPPTFSPYNADGSVKVIAPASLNAYAYQGFQNPLFLLQGINKASAQSLIGSISGEYDILKSLKFKSTVSINYNTNNQNNFVPSTVSIATSSGSGTSGNGIATQGQSQTTNLFYENTLSWDKAFNENHRVNVLVGTSWNIFKSKSFTASGQGFPDDIFLNNLSSASITLPSTGVRGQNSLLSFYARANYSMFDKYIFTFTGRADASSKFPKNNRVGYFPSAGLAWRISSEKFMKDIKWIDEVKIRASAGYTGTQNIGDNLFYSLFSPVSYAGLPGLSPTQLGNDGIKWESTLQKDAGIDFSILKSRLRGGIGMYKKKTTGLLFQTSVAPSSGFTGATANVASLQNVGLELELSGEFLRKKNFQWSGSFNISGNRSKVLKLPSNLGNSADPSMYRYGNTVLKLGEPIGLLYGKTFDGIIQNQAELDAYKKVSRNANSAAYFGIGDARYVLTGVPSSATNPLQSYKDDVIGHAMPDFYGGYTNTLSFKNFSLSTLFTFSKGNEIFYLADAQNTDLSTRTNKGVRILDRWTPENPTATRPRLILGQSDFAYTNSNNIYDASFLRVKSATLSYQLPKRLLSKLGISKAYIYTSATNLFTITGYPGADPEVSNDPYSLIGGYSDVGGYPTVKQYSFGIRCAL